jgi:hypothetical protein
MPRSSIGFKSATTPSTSTRHSSANATELTPTDFYTVDSWVDPRKAKLIKAANAGKTT